MSAKPSLLAVLLVSSALTACERGDPNQSWTASEPTRYCVDHAGHRVEDQQCAQPTNSGGSNAFLWYYLGSLNRNQTYYVPPVGGAAAGGGYAPSYGVSYAPVSESFSVARGGFGGHGGGEGGGE